MMRAKLYALLAVLLLALAPGAQAADPAEVRGVEGAHEADPHASDEHEADEHHYDWTGDADHDQIPNWRDPTDGDQPNEHYVVPVIGWHVFNLALFLGVVFYFARRPVSDEVKNREVNIRKRLTDAARLRDEARQKHEELGARLASFEEEVAQLRSEAAEEARKEEERLIERAEAEAERIREIAERNIREEVVRAQVALRREAVDLAVDLAETTLKNQMQSDDQRRLARQFLDSLHDDEGGLHG